MPDPEPDEAQFFASDEAAERRRAAVAGRQAAGRQAEEMIHRCIKYMAPAGRDGSISGPTPNAAEPPTRQHSAAKPPSCPTRRVVSRTRAGPTPFGVPVKHRNPAGRRKNFAPVEGPAAEMLVDAAPEPNPAHAPTGHQDYCRGKDSLVCWPHRRTCSCRRRSARTTQYCCNHDNDSRRRRSCCACRQRATAATDAAVLRCSGDGDGGAQDAATTLTACLANRLR